MLKAKVYAYVTREREGQTQALVFRHRVPDAPEAGIQVPGGTAEPGERPADTLLRELREEVGIAPNRLTYIAALAVDHHVIAGETVERHFYHVKVDDAPDEWEHVVTGGGEDAGMVFSFFWIERPDEAPLAADQGAYLGRVLASS
jgi:8-oxo-dGTP pyrophosphatase MutT (NUDIX family)